MDVVAHNKQVVHDRHVAVQKLCLGSDTDFRVHMAAAGRHFLAADLGQNSLFGWHSQTMSPSFIGYGPMIANEQYVVEEWESFIHGSDSSLYNNHYCWIQKVEGDQVTEVREYVDSHHVWTVCGRYPDWTEVEPPTQPRQSSLEGTEIALRFPIDVRLLAELQPSGKPDPLAPGGTSAVVERLRAAQQSGDVAAINALHAVGHKHFIAGEGPFGWDHLPLEDLFAPLLEHLDGRLEVSFGPIVADDVRAFQEMEAVAQLDDGSVYHNHHCFVYEVSDGLITQTREYLDTHHMWVVLGRWASWAKEPVPPLAKARRSNLPEVVSVYQHRNPFLDLERWGGLGFNLVGQE